jgi:outer membrane protein OmpA-like peptidoglycan-associated protein
MPDGAQLLSPAETVGLEHEDRKRRLARLSRDLSISPPRFYEYNIPEEELRLAGLPADIPLLRVVFDTGVFFDFDKAEMRPDSAKIVETVAASLGKEPPDVALVIAGHTDSVGTDAYNRALGLARARTVAKALVEKDLPQIRIFSVSFGEAVPIASNGSAAGRAQNRRVEFLFAAHSNAIAFWLSKQNASVCGNAQTNCRFEVTMETPERHAVSLPEKEGAAARLPETDRATATLPAPPQKQSVHPEQDQQQPDDVELKEEKATAELAPKRYVIDLAEKRFEVPAPRY